MSNKRSTSLPFGAYSLHIPTAPATIDDFKIPTDAARPSPKPLVSPSASTATSEPEEAPLTPDQIGEGLRVLAQRGVRLSGNKGRGVRSQFFFGPRQAALSKLTTIAVSYIAGRAVTQALVLRLALVLLSRTADAGLKDPAIAAAIREDLVVAGNAE